jgi:GNAT superfamily N-acetyltransferase
LLHGGNADRLLPLQARLLYWRDNPYTQVRLFFVRLDGRMVARSWIRFGVRENVQTAILHVIVLTEFRGRGLGQALLVHAEELAASRGCTTLQTFTEHPADFDAGGPGLLAPATGTGGVPAEADGVRFALRAKYRLEQVERFSALPLPGAPGGLGSEVKDPVPGTRGLPLNTKRWRKRGSTTNCCTGQIVARTSWLSNWLSLCRA